MNVGSRQHHIGQTVGFAVAAFSCSVAVASSQVIHVVDGAPAGGDGLTWESAFSDLDSALESASGGVSCTIWISEGTYFPTAPSDPDDLRTRRFELPPGITLVGGFAGWESSPDERDIAAHPTWLSGDFAGDDDGTEFTWEDNSYHVVTAVGPGEPISLDGIGIRGGAAAGEGDALRRGGGISASGVTLNINRCWFQGNAAIDRGGALHLDTCTTFITECLFESNLGSFRGGAINVVAGEAVIDQSVFRANATESFGAGSAIAGGLSASITLSDSQLLENVDTVLAMYDSAWLVTGCSFSDNTFSCMYAYESAAHVVGCTMIGNGGATNVAGAVIRVAQSSMVTVEDCFMASNTASNGGVLYVGASDGEVLVRDCVMVGNSSWERGGVCVADGAPSLSVRIERSTLLGNASVNGGAIYVGEGPTLSIVDCEFAENYADECGGAMALVGKSTVLLERTTMRACVAFHDGGAVSSRIDLPDASDVIMRDSVLIGNRALLGSGGGVWMEEGSALFERVTIAGNAAPVAAGVAVEGGVVECHGSVIAGNVSDSGPDLSIEPGASFSATWTCVQGTPMPGTGNIDGDPMFTDLDGPDNEIGSADDEPTLSRWSPCVNTGSPAPLAEDAIDAAGMERVRLCRVDMGALESEWPAAVLVDCDANGTPDECDVQNQTGADCDLDGVLNVCEILKGAADCDGDAQPDSCQLAQPMISLTSPELSPIDLNSPQSWTFEGPIPASDVLLTFRALADLDLITEYFTISINGVDVGTVFQVAINSLDCLYPAESDTLYVTAEEFLALTSGQNATVTVEPSPGVGPPGCTLTFVEVTLEYLAYSSDDLDANGVLDSCQGGDLSGDGIVNGADLGLLLGGWGPCPAILACPADLNADGVVDGVDLGLLLSDWS